MAQASNIVLADAAGSPVNHTFIPVGPLNGFDMIWEDQSRPSPIGFWRIYMKVSDPIKVSPGAIEGTTRRVKLSLREPVLEAIAPAATGLTQPPTVAYEPRCDMEFVISKRSALQDRKDLRKMSYGLLNEAQVINAVENLVNVW